MKPNSRIPSKYRHFIEQNAWMIGGNILFAIGVNMIVTPLGLYNGGFMGMAQLLRLLCVNVLHIPVPAGFDLVGVIYFLENVPLFFLAYKVVGKEFCFKSLVSIGIASLALALVPVPATPIMHDTLAACFVGGVIAPGLALGARSLSAAAARLPQVEPSAPTHVIGRNTREAMRSGVVLGEVARIDGMLDMVLAEMRATKAAGEGDVPIVITGDDAEALAALVGHSLTVDDALTLRGLAELYHINQKPRRA